MKIASAIGLFLGAMCCIGFYAVGMHGHLMFRPGRAEDWIIWGLALAAFVSGLVMLISGLSGFVKRRRQAQ